MSEIKRNTDPLAELPEGLGMALARNFPAMERFGSLPEAAKRQIVEHTHQIGSKQEMAAFVQQIACTVPVENSIRIKTRSVMGTEIPLVEYDKTTNTPTYAYYSTKMSLDEAKAAFEKVKELSIRLSMVENSAYRLAMNIRKTQKRANALKNITIPSYTILVKDISNALEEKEREEFTRLKVIKRNMNH